MEGRREGRNLIWRNGGLNEGGKEGGREIKRK